MKEKHEAMYSMCISRKEIPCSNIEELTLVIETGRLPMDFILDVGKLIGKYERKRLKSLLRENNPK